MQKRCNAGRCKFPGCMTSHSWFSCFDCAAVDLATRPEVQLKAGAFRHCFLLEKRKQLNLFSQAPFYFKALPPVDGHVATIQRCASPVSLSRDAGRLTALMAVKISGKNVDSWESHRQCKGDERESSPLRPLPRKQEGAQLVFIGSPAPPMSPVKHRSTEWARANCAWCRVLSHHVFLLAPLAVCL